jgi:hypothetical protein
MYEAGGTNDSTAGVQLWWHCRLGRQQSGRQLRVGPVPYLQEGGLAGATAADDEA